MSFSTPQPPVPDVTTAELHTDDEARAKRADEALARMGLDPR
jgi:hypothetical protein